MSVNPSMLECVEDSVLKALEKESIVSFHVEGDVVHVGECCDGYFGAFLSKSLLEKLITELQDLHDKL